MKPSPHTQFGLFSIRSFLSSAECDRIRREMSAAEGNPASIVKTDERLLDETARRTVTKAVSEETRRFISEKLTGIKDDVGSYFGVDISRPQKPEFLYYRVGDFFTCHTDKGMNPRNPREVTDRLVSAIEFVNDEKDAPGPCNFSGGAFFIYGLLNDPRFEKQGFKVTGVEGTLIAFRSEMFHEVTAVTGGVRYTVVSWFV